MEDQVKLLGIILMLSGSANILLSILLYMNNREWIERYVAQADRFRREKNKPEAQEPQEIIR
jgi:hypothetical protein